MTRQVQIDASYNRLNGKRGIWRRPIGSMYYWYRFKRGNMLTLCHEEGHWYRANYNRWDITRPKLNKQQREAADLQEDK